MAEKYSVLIKYKYLEYIESAKLSDVDAWRFLKGIIEYDKTGVEPVYENPVLIGLFAVVKIDLDKNRENYEAVSEERSESGKKGAEKRWGKKTEEKTDDGKNGNCHLDKENMANDSKNSNCHKNQKNMAKMHDLDSGCEFDLSSAFEKNKKESGGGCDPQKTEKPPPLFFNIKNQIKEKGFFFDDSQAIENLISKTAPAWFEDHSFITFIAEIVEKEYGDKTKREQCRIFRKLLFDADNLRDEYPQWQKEQKIKAEKKAQAEMTKLAREKVPKQCSCGGELNVRLTCLVCGGVYEFCEEIAEYVFHEGVAESLSSGFEKLKRGG